jgi:hypothetical protein
MGDLVATAQRLRTVKKASAMFLARWALQQALERDYDLDRAAVTRRGRRWRRQVANPHNRDWSLLYRGSVLDD